mgnify:CR=1 FL=1
MKESKNRQANDQKPNHESSNPETRSAESIKKEYEEFMEKLMNGELEPGTIFPGGSFTITEDATGDKFEL